MLSLIFKGLLCESCKKDKINTNSVSAPSVHLDSLSCYLCQCHFKTKVGC